jgi:hypothetical protein
MKVWYHVFEPSDDDRMRCAWCGNQERAATGTGHVESQGEANRLNRKAVKP